VNIDDGLATVWTNRLICVEIYVRRPGLVLLHAGVADRRSWYEVARGLVHEATVVAYDRRVSTRHRHPPPPFLMLKACWPCSTKWPMARPGWLVVPASCALGRADHPPVGRLARW